MRRFTARVIGLSWAPSHGASREHAGHGRSDAYSFDAATPRRTFFGAVIAALTLGALVSLLGASVAAGAVGEPFSCKSEIDFLTQSHENGEPTKYYESEFKAGEVVYNEVNSESAASTYNALGYDPMNNYLYSTELNQAPLGSGKVGTLFQIDNTGHATSLGLIKGYPAESGGPANGAFDP